MQPVSNASLVLLITCLLVVTNLGGCNLVRGQVTPESIGDDLTKPVRIVADLASVPQPSQRRDWRPELAVLPFAEINGDKITVRHVRQCRWHSETDYDVKHLDWQFSIDDIRSVDFVVVPFPATPMLAHTMLSFGLSDGRRLALSVEARLEAHESYSAIAGTARQYDLIYILADESDLLGLRAEVRRDDIYLYRTIATPDQSATILKNVLERANSLRENPEFYDSLRNSCATNVADHIEQIRPGRIRDDWRLLLPGHSDKLAYDLKLIDTSRPFEDARRRAFISVRARQHLGSPNFSELIRNK